VYSWEIDKEIKSHNNQISASVYLEISDVNKSPQIDHIKYNAYSNCYSMWTKDGWCWNFQVYKD
jgi:hypothetical protein